jgi:hypothetical protein
MDKAAPIIETYRRGSDMAITTAKLKRPKIREISENLDTTSLEWKGNGSGTCDSSLQKIEKLKDD